MSSKIGPSESSKNEAPKADDVVVEKVKGPDGRMYEKRADGNLYPEGHKSLYRGEGKVTFIDNKTAVSTKSMKKGSEKK